MRYIILLLAVASLLRPSVCCKIKEIHFFSKLVILQAIVDLERVTKDGINK